MARYGNCQAELATIFEVDPHVDRADRRLGDSRGFADRQRDCFSI